jgi:adenylosuccinate lyase
MRHIWSETYKRRVWRKIWFHLADVQSQYGLVTSEQVQVIGQHIDRSIFSAPLKLKLRFITI